MDLMATELRWEYSGSLVNTTVRSGVHRILLLELYPVHMALQQLSNSVLALKSDNIALVSILTVCYSRNKLINLLVKLCVNVLMDHNIVLRVEYIAGILLV